jgi:hypothetical protein
LSRSRRLARPAFARAALFGQGAAGVRAVLGFALFVVLALAPHLAGRARAQAPPTPPSVSEESLPAAPAPILESATPTGYRVRVPVGPARVSRARIAGYELSEIQIPGGSAGGAWGQPSLPWRTILLRVPWGSDPVARGARAGVRSLGSMVPVPIAHLVTEEAVRSRVSPEAVADAMKGAPYRALGGSGEAPVIASTAPMASGGLRYLAVTIRPVSWDPVSREARAAEEVLLEVSWSAPAAALPEGPLRPAPGLSARDALRGNLLEVAEAVGPRFAPLPSLGPRSRVALAAAGPLRVDPSRPWVRVGAIRPGLYRITSSDLISAGVAGAPAIDPSTFRLFRSTPGDLPESTDVDAAPDSLRECAITVAGEGDGSFDSSDAIYFYATGESGFGYDLVAGGGPEYQETQRTDQEPLWLTWGPGPVASPPRRIGARDAAPSAGPAPLLTEATHRVHFEVNKFPEFDLFQAPLRWERWFWSIIPVGARLAFPITLPGALPGGAASARLRVWGQATSAGHSARLWWDGAMVDSASWNFLAARDLVASGLRTNGSRDTVQVEVPNVAGRTKSEYLAWFEISYPRRLAASSDTLAFAAPDSIAPGRSRYAVTAISDTTSAWLLDRTDPENPVRLTGGTWSGTAPSFTLTVEDSAGGGYRPRYSLVSTARAAAPALARYAPPASPHSLADLLDPANAADYLIVTPPVFLAAAESLAADRAARLPGFASPRAAIATTDRIAAQLAGGRSDPVAIRNLLAYAQRHWAAGPLYVCLLGDASDDPKNYTGFSVPDLLPTYNEYWDSTILVQFISDDFYAFLDGPGDQLFDLAIGRLPASNASEALFLALGKNRAYDRAQDFDWWRTRALLTADDAWKWSIPTTKRDPVGADHVTQMERKDALHLPFPVRREKVYLNDYPFADSTKQSKPRAREAFIAAVNAGNWIVEFSGHGNENFLADEQLFRESDRQRLTNQARPSIFGFFSCTVGKFDDNETQNDLAESLLRHPGGGSVVSLAASQEVFGAESARLNDAFVDALFPLRPRVDTLRTAGLAWAEAKNAPTNQNSVVRKYGYLGDPAVTPPLPRGRGVFQKDALDSIPRGEIAVIQGHALNADSTLDVVSSGTVLLEVLGPPSRRIEIADRSGVPSAIPYALPGPVLYRGETTLDQGVFTLRFVVPTDGRIIGPGTQLRALLSQAGGRGVGLAADSLRIAAALAPRVDATPPTIRLLGPAGGDSTVAPGAVLTFAIEDSSGIDLTRLDDAHSVFTIVDDRGTPIDMTPTFRYEPSSYTRGTATLLLPQLAGGAHLLEVHASDTYRNVGIATFTIDVAAGVPPGSALLMTEVFNYPNPFPRETYLHARLNQPARLHVQILTVAGRRVRDFALDGKAGENYIPWDGRDSQGEKVALGVYIVKLTAEAPGGNRASAIARALRAE